MSADLDAFLHWCQYDGPRWKCRAIRQEGHDPLPEEREEVDNAGHGIYPMLTSLPTAFGAALARLSYLCIIATDVDRHVFARARRGWYPKSSMRELPPDWIEAGFTRLDNGYVVRDMFREAVCFLEQDIRKALPPGHFDLILCRNLVFTYFATPVQRDILARIVARLVPGGILLVGKHESLPQDCQHVVAYDAPRGLFQKVAVSP